MSLTFREHAAIALWATAPNDSSSTAETSVHQAQALAEAFCDANGHDTYSFASVEPRGQPGAGTPATAWMHRCRRCGKDVAP